jgi:WD40 repeat protein/thioredoxin-like negative regulator of GroEL
VLCLLLAVCVPAAQADAVAWSQAEEWREPGGEILTVAVAPDGLTFATGAVDGTVRLRDVLTGGSTALRGHTSPVNDIAYAPTGRYFVSAGRDRMLRIWDVSTRSLLREIRAHRTAVTAVAVDSTREIIVSGGSDGLIRFFDANRGRQLREYAGRSGRRAVHDLLIDAGGDLTLVSGGPFASESRRINGIGITDAAPRGERYLTDEGDANNAVIARSADGKTFAVAGDTGVLTVWAAGAPARKSTAHNSAILGVAVTPTGEVIATAGADNTVRLWDAATGDALDLLRGHSRPVNDVAFGPEGNLLVSVGRDRTARLWRPSAPDPAATNSVATESARAPVAPRRAHADTSPSPGAAERANSPSLREGVGHFQEGRYAEAAALLERAIQDVPDAVGVYGLLAVTRWREGSAEQASAVIGRAEQRGFDIDVPEPLLKYRSAETRTKEALGEAIRARVSGNLDHALTMCQEALLLSPQSRNARELGLGVYDSMLAGAPAGSAAHEALVERRQAWVDLDRGHTLMEQGDLTGAIRELESATARDAQLAEAFKWLACAAAARQDMPTARRALTQALTLVPDLTLTTPLAQPAFGLLARLRAEQTLSATEVSGREGTLFIASTPGGAQAKVGSRPAASTPAFYALPPGDYTIEVQADNYETDPKSVTVTHGDTTVVMVELVHSTQLRVTSRLAGVDIHIEELRVRRRAPAFVRSMGPGEYTVSGTRKGYKTASKQVTVAAAILNTEELTPASISRGAMALRSAFPGFGQFHGGRPFTGTGFLLGTVGAAAAAAAVHFQYYESAAAEHAAADDVYSDAFAAPDIERAWARSMDTYEEVNRWGKLRNTLAITAGALWVANIAHGLLAGPATGAPQARDGSALSLGDRHDPRMLVVPRANGTGAAVELQTTF